jgi:hypothetical protein
MLNKKKTGFQKKLVDEIFFINFCKSYVKYKSV